MPPSSASSEHRSVVPALLRTRKFWLCVLMVLIGVVCFLALTPPPPQEANLGWDKLNHAAAFAALTFAGWLGLPRSRRSHVALLLGLLALGGLIEVLQSFVPGRDASAADLLADAVGLAVGGLLAHGLLWVRLRRRANAAR